MTNKNGGFIQLIIVVIIALFVMKYMGLTITDAVNWFKVTFGSVLR